MADPDKPTEGPFLAIRGLPQPDGTTLSVGFTLAGDDWLRVTDSKSAKGAAIARGEQLEKAAREG